MIAQLPDQNEEDQSTTAKQPILKKKFCYKLLSGAHYAIDYAIWLKL